MMTDPVTLVTIITASLSTSEVMRDWFFERFLGNIDLVVILGLLRMWSQSEHRKTAEALRSAREELALAVANTAEKNATAASAENAVILAEVKANTVVTEQAVTSANDAYREANSVNEKIAALRNDQNDLRRDTT